MCKATPRPRGRRPARPPVTCCARRLPPAPLLLACVPAPHPTGDPRPVALTGGRAWGKEASSLLLRLRPFAGAEPARPGPESGRRGDPSGAEGQSRKGQGQQRCPVGGRGLGSWGQAPRWGQQGPGGRREPMGAWRLGSKRGGPAEGAGGQAPSQLLRPMEGRALGCLEPPTCWLDGAPPPPGESQLASRPGPGPPLRQRCFVGAGAGRGSRERASLDGGALSGSVSLRLAGPASVCSPAAGGRARGRGVRNPQPGPGGVGRAGGRGLIRGLLVTAHTKGAAPSQRRGRWLPARQGRGWTAGGRTGGQAGAPCPVGAGQGGPGRRRRLQAGRAGGARPQHPCGAAAAGPAPRCGQRLAPSWLPGLSGPGPASPGREDVIAISQRSFRSSGAGPGAAGWSGRRPPGLSSPPPA